MQISTVLSSLALLLVGAFFVINTGASDGKNQEGKMKDGVCFQSGIISDLNKKKIDYTIFTSDYGVHWWAVEQTKNKWHISGTAEEIYPGLIKLLNDPIHAELALMDYQEKNKKGNK